MKLFASCSYNDQKEKIQTYCIIFLVFAVASLISYIIQNGMFAVAGEELTKRIRKQLNINHFNNQMNTIKL